MGFVRHLSAEAAAQLFSQHIAPSFGDATNMHSTHAAGAPPTNTPFTPLARGSSGASLLSDAWTMPRLLPGYGLAPVGLNGLPTPAMGPLGYAAPGFNFMPPQMTPGPPSFVSSAGMSDLPTGHMNMHAGPHLGLYAQQPPMPAPSYTSNQGQAYAPDFTSHNAPLYHNMPSMAAHYANLAPRQAEDLLNSSTSTLRAGHSIVDDEDWDANTQVVNVTLHRGPGSNPLGIIVDSVAVGLRITV
jgi:hypothetical protein